MENQLPAFLGFRNELIDIYTSDPAGFWEISMSRFLDYFSKPEMLLKRSKNVLRMTTLLSGLEKDASAVIFAFDQRWGTDISGWKSNRKQYLQDAFPVFAMLAIWMHDHHLNDLLEEYDQVLIAGVYAVVGYSILDDNLDSNNPNPVELLTAQLLLAEYERMCYEIFGSGESLRKAFHQIRLLFIESEIREKKSRWKRSPYQEGRAIDLGTKGLNAVAPFILCLEKAGKADETGRYIEIFLLIGAVIQMLDDWNDLEDDLTIGHYAYITLGVEQIAKKQKSELLKMIRNEGSIRSSYQECHRLLSDARILLAEVDDPIVMKLLEVTEKRMEGFYHKTFGQYV